VSCGCFVAVELWTVAKTRTSFLSAASGTGLGELRLSSSGLWSDRHSVIAEQLCQLHFFCCYIHFFCCYIHFFCCYIRFIPALQLVQS
jgi:hypothetical protein